MKSRRRSSKAAPPARDQAPVSASQEGVSPRLLPWLYLAVGLLALAVRVVYLLELRDALPFSTLVVDARVYDAWAQEISGGDWLGREIFYQSPLYPYFMGTIYRLFGYDPMYVRGVQAVFGSLGCVLVAWAGSVFFSPKTGIVAGVLLALYPPAIFFDGLIQKASLDLLLMSLTLALLAQFLARPRMVWAVLAGASLGLLILNRENARLMYPVTIGWFALYFREAAWGRRALWAASVTAGVALVLLPVGVRNYRVGGEFLLTTAQLGPNFYIGNHEGASGLYEPLIEGRAHTVHERVDAVRLAEEARGRQLSPAEVSDYWRDRALQYIRQNPTEWLRLMGWKALLTFHDLELVDSEGIEVYTRFSWLLWALSWFSFGLVVPVAVVGLWATRQQWRQLAILYVLLIGFAASVVLFFVFARYRYPLLPILMLFAAAALVALPDMVRAARGHTFWREWGPGLVAALLVAIPVNWPLPQYSEEAVAYANYGKELLDERKLDEAVGALELALALRPDFDAARHNLGATLALQGKTAEANAEYRRVLQHNPRYGRSHWLLGRNLAAAGQLAEAKSHLLTAAELLPEEALIRIDLGQAFAGDGDRAAALAAFREALRLDPQSALAANNLAWMLATSRDVRLRNGPEAMRLIAPFKNSDEPELLDTLAAVQAELGEWDAALATIARAIQGAEANKSSKLAEQLRARERNYQERQPIRE
jgi:tetratricopeptide (TPR) repeat protein